MRPTASKIRQAFFNILAYKVPEARFLDLFAGSGLMGIEALSRGASSLTFVEESRRQVRTIEANLQKLGAPGDLSVENCEVIFGDVRKVIPTLPRGGFDIIFADPPYQTKLPLKVLETVDLSGVLADDGVLVIEHARELKMPEGSEHLIQSDYRTYGQTAFSFFRHKS